MERATQAFDRMMQSASGVPGLAKADRETSARIAEIDALERRSKIERRMSELRTSRVG